MTLNQFDIPQPSTKTCRAVALAKDEPSTISASGQNFLPPPPPVSYHCRSAIRAKQTPNRPRAAACPDSMRRTPVLKAITLRVLEEPPPCTTPAVMPATFIQRLSRDRLKNVRL